MKILTTAVFSVFMLGKRLRALQWGSLIILTIGAISDYLLQKLYVFSSFVCKFFSGEYSLHAFLPVFLLLFSILQAPFYPYFSFLLFPLSSSCLLSYFLLSSYFPLPNLSFSLILFLIHSFIHSCLANLLPPTLFCYEYMIWCVTDG